MSRKHQFDQHFLRSPRLVAELIGHSNIRKNDVVYDLGAGSGVISSVLARRARSVVAIENEPATLDKLRKNLEAYDNVRAVGADILEVPFPSEAYKVFANPPFSLISPLLQRLAFAAATPKSIYLIVQKQFAQKIVPSDARFTSALGIQLWPQYVARIRRPLRKSDFTPPPAVETVLLELKLREQPLLVGAELNKFRHFVGRRYENPQLISAADRHRCRISAEKKPSEITPEEWLKMFQA